MTSPLLSFPNLTYIDGDLFPSKHQSLDFEPFQQLYIDGGIAGAFASQGPTPPRPAASSAPSSGGGLSTGAKGGIAAAAVVAAGLATVGIVIMIRRKHDKRADCGIAGNSCGL
jgi:hypothetical protein